MYVALQGSNLGASSTQQAAAMPGQNAYGRCTRHEPAPARPAQSGVSCLPEMVMSSDYAAARRDYRFRYSGLREAGARLSDRILMSSLVAQTSSSSSSSLETPVSISMPARSQRGLACVTQSGGCTAASIRSHAFKHIRHSVVAHSALPAPSQRVY